ncbi:hypothetical protein PI124_g21122 [Phytophthora idaei]|nr:hypothetical protein PI125_g23050 [Phytophthora idaei]KAG3129586.1 hypothetical protein PI126_g20900 [Phytophthora idaei]KAG3233819.1 hypothetical protein PI124_g21122 [Phytophthora idaei]
MAKGSTTVPATPSKSGGARNESSSPDVTAPRLATVSELSVNFEDEEEHGPDAQDDYDEYENKTPAPEPGAVTPETATLSSGAERGDEVTFEEPRRRAGRRCWIRSGL